VSAFPNEERSRGETTTEELRKRFPRACIVSVLLPGMLLGDNGIERIEAADKAASSLGQAVEICMDMQRAPIQA